MRPIHLSIYLYGGATHWRLWQDNSAEDARSRGILVWERKGSIPWLHEPLTLGEVLLPVLLTLVDRLAADPTE